MENLAKLINDCLEIRTLYGSARLEEREARHLFRLLKSSKNGPQLMVVSESRNGLDGETFHGFGIRRKDGRIPRGYRRLYTIHFCLGWLDYQPEAVAVIKRLREIGADVPARIELDARDLVAGR